MTDLQAIINRLAPQFKALQQPCYCKDGWLYFDRGQTGFYLECWNCQTLAHWPALYRDDPGAKAGNGWKPVTWNPDAPWLARLLTEMRTSGEFFLIRIDYTADRGHPLQCELALYRGKYIGGTTVKSGATEAESVLLALDGVRGGNHDSA